MEERTYYLTKQGLKKLKKDLEGLRKIRYSKIKGEVPSILHSEDINSEYLSFWEDADFLENRIVELEYVMKNFEIIKKPLKERQSFIDLGATVLTEANGEKVKFKIVGSLEANPSLGKISERSLVGKSLLGCKKGDIVRVKSSFPITYKIIGIKYEDI